MPEQPDYSKLPERLRGGVQRYIEKGIIPGDFLIAIIQNNLTETFARADDDMIKVIQEIVSWFYWEPPAGCWGSITKMNKWAKERHQEYQLKTDKI